MRDGLASFQHPRRTRDKITSEHPHEIKQVRAEDHHVFHPTGAGVLLAVGAHLHEVTDKSFAHGLSAGGPHHRHHCAWCGSTAIFRPELLCLREQRVSFVGCGDEGLLAIDVGTGAQAVATISKCRSAWRIATLTSWGFSFSNNSRWDEYTRTGPRLAAIFLRPGFVGIGESNQLHGCCGR